MYQPSVPTHQETSAHGTIAQGFTTYFGSCWCLGLPQLLQDFLTGPLQFLSQEVLLSPAQAAFVPSIHSCYRTNTGLNDIAIPCGHKLQTYGRQMTTVPL